MSIDWSTVFEKAVPMDGLPEREVRRLLGTELAPISTKEAAKFAKGQKNPFSKKDSPEWYDTWRPINPLNWRMPARPFPESYISFLAWCNGGGFGNGDRTFDMYGFDDFVTGIREAMIENYVPEFFPDTVPFGSDGGLVLYLFDMREPAIRGEYPIICAEAASWSWSNPRHAQMALNFEEFCRGRSRIESILFPPDEESNKDEEGKNVPG